jgi:hypothetical protein
MKELIIISDKFREILETILFRFFWLTFSFPKTERLKCGRKWQEAGEHCTVRSFITCTRHQILLGSLNQG